MKKEVSLSHPVYVKFLCAVRMGSNDLLRKGDIQRERERESERIVGGVSLHFTTGKL
jgi:hypothetical protein